jgi:hypothetical protein
VSLPILLYCSFYSDLLHFALVSLEFLLDRLELLSPVLVVPQTAVEVMVLLGVHHQPLLDRLSGILLGTHDSLFMLLL